MLLHNPIANAHNPPVLLHNPIANARNPPVLLHNPIANARNPLVLRHNPIVNARNSPVLLHNPVVNAHNPLVLRHNPITEELLKGESRFSYTQIVVVASSIFLYVAPLLLPNLVKELTMPYFEAPRNDAARLTFLQRALTTSQSDRAAGSAYLSLDSETDLAAFVPQFQAAFNALSSTQSARSREVRQRREALDKLATHVRDFWEGLRRRARRLEQPAEVLTFYQLPLDGTTPKPTPATQWLTVAENIISGEAEAVAAGYPPMANPSAAEVQTVLFAARTEAAEADTADRVYDTAQETLAALRGEADRWVEDIMAELRFTLRRRETASQRRIMRTYGAEFSYLAGESLDPDDQPVDGQPVEGQPVAGEPA